MQCPPRSQSGLAGNSQGFRLFLGLLDGFIEGRLQGTEDDSGGLLDDLKALGQQRGIAVVKLDVIGVMLCTT